MKNLTKNLLIIVLGLLVVGGVAYAYMGNSPKVVVEGNYIEAGDLSNSSENLGGFYSPDIEGLKLKTAVIAKTSITASTTLMSSDSGTTYFLSASGTQIILPKVAKGLNFKFVIDGASDNANYVIDSNEGDNIDGTLIVAGAVVDCRGEDQINFVTDGEQKGDYVELYSNGTQWLIGDSGGLTAGKITCTDPS